VACSEFRDGGRRKWAVHRLNTHKLAPVGIQIGLEWSTISRFEQQLSPWISRPQNDLVDALPGH